MSRSNSVHVAPEAPKITIGNYILGRSIGRGTFGKVRMAQHSQLNEKVAIKILEKDKIKTRGDTQRVTREIKILKQVNHPHIIQLFELIETSKQIFLVMELAEGGELFNHIVSKHRLSENESCKYLNQTLSGLESLQRLCISHRDLKPENLLLDSKKNIKIVDFGLSNFYKPGELLKTACGSPCYAAPEMIAGKKYLGSQADMWSVGVILFAMLCGYLPFEDANTSNLYKKILAGEFKIPNWLSSEAADILKKILVTDPERRLNIEMVRCHPWFIKHSSGLDLYPIEKLEFNDAWMAQLTSLGYNSQYIKECLIAGKLNSGTAVYRIIAHMHKLGKKVLEVTRLRRSIGFVENKVLDRPGTRMKTMSPVTYRPVTSYEFNYRLPPATGGKEVTQRNGSPRVKTPLNAIFKMFDNRR